MPHPNSLMYNVYPFFWPMKVYWFCRKSLQILFIRDFPPVPEGHPDEKIVRGLPMPSFMKHWVVESWASVYLRASAINEVPFINLYHLSNLHQGLMGSLFITCLYLKLQRSEIENVLNLKWMLEQTKHLFLFIVLIFFFDTHSSPFY